MKHENLLEETEIERKEKKLSELYKKYDELQIETKEIQEKIYLLELYLFEEIYGL